MDQIEARILISRRLGESVLADVRTPECGFHVVAEALGRFAQRAIAGKDLRLLREVCDTVKELLLSADGVIGSGLDKSFFPLLKFGSDDRARSWMPPAIYFRWGNCQMEQETGVEEETVHARVHEEIPESLEILTVLRAPAFPVLVSADGELWAARGMAKFGCVLLKVLTSLGAAAQVLVLDRNGDAFGVRLENGQALVHPEFLTRSWTKSQFIDLYDSSKNAQRLGVRYSSGGLSNKRRDTLIQEIYKLVLKAKAIARELSRTSSVCPNTQRSVTSPDA